MMKIVGIMNSLAMITLEVHQYW